MKFLKKIFYYLLVLFYFIITVVNLLMITSNFNRILNNEQLYGIIGILIFAVSLVTFVSLITKKEYAFYFSILYGILDILQQTTSKNTLKIENLVPAIVMIILSFILIKFFKYD